LAQIKQDYRLFQVSIKQPESFEAVLTLINSKYE